MTQPQGSTPNTTTFDQLLQPLQDALDQIENQRTRHHRETLSFRAFVRLLLYYFTASVESGRQLLTDTLSAAPSLGLEKVKRSTFFDGFNRFPVRYFQILFATLLGTLALPTIPELAMVGRLLCVDGSLFPALATMYWAHYQSGSNAVRLHLAFELNRMVAVSILVDSGNSSERSALRQMLESGVTYLLDRGYVSFPLLAEIAAAGAYFVMRQKSNLNYSVVEQLAVSLPEQVEALYSEVRDLKVLLTGSKDKPLYRLVCFVFEGTSYRLLTNRWDLTTFEVMLLYSYRWQVELFFRYFKRTLGGLHLLSSSKTGVTIQFYALLMTALLQLHLKQRCVAACEMASEQGTPGRLEVDVEELIEGSGSTFLATVGQKLQRWWKISVHWLVHLRNYLGRCLDEQGLYLLGTT